jgi:dynactin complex subunit
VYVCRIPGTVAYVGSVDYAKGTYIGVVTDNVGDGKNNGTSTVCSCRDHDDNSVLVPYRICERDEIF